MSNDRNVTRTTNEEKTTGINGAGANQQIPAALSQTEKGLAPTQTGSGKKRSKIPFIAAGAAVLVVIAALIFFLGRNDNSFAAKAANAKFDEITIVCHSQLHVGESIPLAVDTGDTLFFATSSNITWSVDDSSVAYVSMEGDGALVGVSEGKVTITAEINGITDSKEVEVIAAE